MVRALSREMHPSVERRRALLAPAAWLDAHGVRRSFYGVAQPDFFVNEEAWKTNPVRLALGTVLFLALHKRLSPSLLRLAPQKPPYLRACFRARRRVQTGVQAEAATLLPPAATKGLNLATP